MPSEPTPFSRSTRMLRTALGTDIGGYIEDPDIVEVMRIRMGGYGSIG